MERGKINVYVLRDGLIIFGTEGPEGAIPVVSGPEDILRPIIEVNANLCWDNTSFRVGDLATTKNDDKAFKILCEWADRINAQLQERLREPQEASHAQA